MNLDDLIKILSDLKAKSDLLDSKDNHILIGERDNEGNITAKQINAFFVTKMADNKDFIFLLSKEDDKAFIINNEEMEKSEKVRKETLDLSKRVEH